MPVYVFNSVKVRFWHKSVGRKTGMSTMREERTVDMLSYLCTVTAVEDVSL